MDRSFVSGLLTRVEVADFTVKEYEGLFQTSRRVGGGAGHGSVPAAWRYPSGTMTIGTAANDPSTVTPDEQHDDDLILDLPKIRLDR
jgi:hypothetical protein